MCMYVSELGAEGIFATFHWWLKNVKSRPKMLFVFSNERHFEIWFPKKKTIMFLWKYLNYTKKTQFCMWQLHFPLNKGKQEQAVDPFQTP